MCRTGDSISIEVERKEVSAGRAGPLLLFLTVQVGALGYSESEIFTISRIANGVVGSINQILAGWLT